MEQLIEYFACFGGVEKRLEFDFFESLEESVGRIYVEEFDEMAVAVPEYLRRTPYRKPLVAIARGDGRIYAALHRAGVGESLGEEILAEMESDGILRMEASREAPLRTHPRERIKKKLRHYRIQPKARFAQPYLRFWFAFVEPYAAELERGEGEAFLSNWRQHRDRAFSLVFEQLANELLELHFAQSDPLLSKGSYWDRRSEFDLLCRTSGGETILGECKYTGKPVSRREIRKLREKAAASGIRADRFALFARSGFTRELRESGEPDLLLFGLEDFGRLVEGEA